MLRPIRRPAYGGPVGAKGSWRICNTSCMVMLAFALLGIAASLNYVSVERRRCTTRLDELEEDIEQKESAIARLKQQVIDLRQGAAAAAAPAPAPTRSKGRKQQQVLDGATADAWDESASSEDEAGSNSAKVQEPKQPQPRLRNQGPAGKPAAPPAPPAPVAAAKPAAPVRPQAVDKLGRTIEPAPANTREARALLVICFNRPQYLSRTLGAVLERLPAYNRPHVYVSQDGDVGAVTDVIEAFKARFATEAPDVPFTHWRHPPVAPEALSRAAAWAIGYYKLAQHFGWALARIFGPEGGSHPRVLILEDDLEVAVDFFDFMTAMEPLLDDESQGLLAVSAWSDTGQPQFVADPAAVHRSDFFPGLGWMINAHAWEDLGPKWPDSFWDDWLREPPQRRGRAVLRPQISRTFTFGEEGVSRAQFFDQYLGNIHLNDVPVDWAAQDTAYLAKGAYDADLASAVAGARAMSQEDAVSAVCQPREGGGPPAIKTVYTGFEGPAGYEQLAGRFGFINDVKAGVPRTAYMGVVHIRHNGCVKLLVPTDFKPPAGG